LQLVGPARRRIRREQKKGLCILISHESKAVSLQRIRRELDREMNPP